MTRVCLVGAGNISGVHAAALRALPGRTVAAIVDPSTAAAQRLSRAVGGAAVFADIEQALAAGGFDRAHVLVPPDLHDQAALPFLRAGIPVLIEKPLAATSAGCASLLAAAGGTALGVNQNFVHHPAFVRLRAMLDSGAYGRPRFLSCIYHAELRQITARQFGHWMFREPVNILLEQAVHPLSQIVALAGPVARMQAMAGPMIDIASGVPFMPSADLTLDCDRMPAQMRFAVGQTFAFWQMRVMCDDGVIVADMLADQAYAHGRTRWLEATDRLASGLGTAGGIARDSVRNVARYGLSQVRLAGRSDAFYTSMKGSIAAFHDAVDAGRSPALNGRFGADLVALCEAVRDQAIPAGTTRPPTPTPAPAAPVAADAKADVALLGGTGFIGVHTVRALLDAGRRVSVMARSLRNLPAVLGDPRVSLHRGDIRDADAVARAIGEATVVVNLAHGGGGGTFEEIRAAMVGGAETVAEVCRERGVKRLVHVGSVAALYLGDQPEPVTGATPPDPQAERRADYARAKVLADRMLLGFAGLGVVILRPGIVVGEGGPAFHSGLGFFNTEQHCIGWGGGRTELPFVLVQDVAAAIVAACFADGIDGRSYNLVGDVRMTARDYTATLGRALGRPLKFHPQSPTQLWLEDTGKWLVKRVGGRTAPRPQLRDFRSRAMTARFDCGDAKRDLGWRPEADRAAFVARAIDVHAAH